MKKMLNRDPDQRIKAVVGLNDKWILNLTRARKGSQPKILGNQVLKNLKRFLVSICL